MSFKFLKYFIAIHLLAMFVVLWGSGAKKAQPISSEHRPRSAMSTPNAN